MPAPEFNQLLTSVLRAFHPRHSRWRAGEGGGANEQAAKLKKALPYKVSKRLAELFQEHESRPFSSARWRTVVQETGNRAGLLMCGDLATAARVVLRETLPDRVELDPRALPGARRPARPPARADPLRPQRGLLHPPRNPRHQRHQRRRRLTPRNRDALVDTPPPGDYKPLPREDGGTW